MMLAPAKILKSPYSILLLNQVTGKVSKPADFTRIWNNATKRIAVDGGTNAWYALKKEDSQLQPPDYVSGDFDSIEPCVLDYVKGLGQIKVVHTPDQDETDFTKALHILRDDPESPPTILAICPATTGRLDHFFAGINTLIKSLSLDVQLYMYDFENIAFPITAGTDTKRIEVPAGTTCGIIPMDGPTHMTSEGLKWDLDGSTYGFGGIVSTSNETVRDVVSLTTDRVLIFSAFVTL